MTGGSLIGTRRIARSVSGIHADDLGRGDAAVGQLDADLVRSLNDMVIGDDVTGRIDDHAGAEAALDALAHCGQMLPQQRIRARGPGGGVDHARRIDVDDCGAGAPHGVGKGASRLAGVARRNGAIARRGSRWCCRRSAGTDQQHARQRTPDRRRSSGAGRVAVCRSVGTATRGGVRRVQMCIMRNSLEL